ncbi:hypothetical protein LM83088_160043 [Listeria monocytogenes]|nr:hypothetical protein LM7456_210044 [Listeria monocytogenes]CUL81293.1 hypothetical protein LM83088_160043 [Listeria monocytogenes]
MRVSLYSERVKRWYNAVVAESADALG